MNVPEITTTNQVKINFLEIYENEHQFPDMWDFNKAQVRKPSHPKYFYFKDRQGKTHNIPR
jgi:hypothetical protein